MPLYDKDPPNTSDPRKISNYLGEQNEHLKYLFSNIGTENLSEELYELIQGMLKTIDEIQSTLNSLLETAEQEE